MTDDPARPVLRAATALYLELHRHPELSGHEEATAARFAARLEEYGLRTTAGVGGHGVVGVLANGPGPVVMLRAELDALPVQERTGLPYASAVEGVAHACGHDLHLAAAAGAAAALARSRASWSGTLLVVGQPAEETLTGARAMLDDGLFTRFPRPDAVLAQHAAPLPAGMVAHGAGGPVTAGSVSLEAVVHGAGGHAATPHLGRDPVVAAAAAVLRLQTVVSREAAPAEQVVLTVGSLHAGTAPNVLPDRAVLGLTVRGYSEASLDRAVAAVKRIVRAECAASDCPRPPDFTVLSRSPVNVPDPAATAAVRRAHVAAFGPERVAAWPPSPATEDFPLFAADGIPTAYWMLGTASRSQWTAARTSSPTGNPAALPANHSPHYAPDIRTALPTAITAMTTAALAFLAGTASAAAPANPE